MVPGGYVMAEGPSGVPMAFPVQQTGVGVTIPYGHAEIVPMPPQGVTQVTDQPPPYDQISTTGSSSSTAERDPPPPYSKDEQVSEKCCVCSCLMQKVDCSQYPIFPVRLSRSNALRYGLPIWHECQNYLGSGARATIPEARSIGTFENQDGLH